MSEPFLEMRGVTKRFPGVVANDGIDFSVRRGEIHGLLGENGAGKSTLMKVLYGLYSPDAGSITLDGRRLQLDSPQEAIDSGVGMVHQHFMLIPRLSVVENVVLGEREPAGAIRNHATDGLLGGLLRRFGELFSLGLDEPSRRVRALADEYGLEVDPRARVWDLDIGDRQRVEILKALYRDVDLLVLDEPTAVLTPAESRRMFDTLRALVDRGLTIVFITHKLEEVEAVADRVTVLREGRRVDTVDVDAVDRDDLAEMMVGREVLFSVDREPVSAGDPVLRASGLRADDDRGMAALSGVDLAAREGEIVGVAGVSGNGQTELAECLVGVREPTAGRIDVDGRDLTGARPRAFVDADVSFVPGDRLGQGCAPDLSVMHNATMKTYREGRFGGHGLLDYDDLAAHAAEIVEAFDVRGVSDVRETPAGDLSGGNLQKLILGRELARDPTALVAVQPTRGVDVGAIEAVREALLDQRRDGTAVVLVSEDLDELFDLSDRLLVVYEGEVVLETTPEETDRETVGLAMTGGAGGAGGTEGTDRAVTDGGGSGSTAGQRTGRGTPERGRGGWR